MRLEGNPISEDTGHCLSLSVGVLYIWPRRQQQHLGCASSEAAPVEFLFQLHNVLTERDRLREMEDGERKPVVKVSNKTKRCCALGCDRRL